MLPVDAPDCDPDAADSGSDAGALGVTKLKALGAASPVTAPPLASES